MVVHPTFNRTKIIATVGPSIEDSKMIIRLIQAGVDVFRFNFSHGTHEYHEKIIHRIQKINTELGTNICMFLDLQGPKIRTGLIEGGSVILKQGQLLKITHKELTGNREIISTSYKKLASDVKPGNKILVDDGNLEFRVTFTNGIDEILVKVIKGGVLFSKKGINLPFTGISAPSFTEKDKADVEFALKNNIDWIALSFVRNADDVENLRKFILSKGKETRIIAKIEKPEAIKNIDEIIRVSDAIMVARGDLGVEIKMEEVPVVQKMIVKKANLAAKPVIIATQMMESMITKHIPTRAETNDIANAVLDGADALMLSAETSIGSYPVEAVQHMVKTITAIERSSHIYFHEPDITSSSPTFYNDNVVASASRLAKETKATAIIGVTTSGYTAFRLAAHRPKSSIFIFSGNRELLKILNLVWGLRCFYYNKHISTDRTISDIAEILYKNGMLKKGEIYINTTSMPIGERKRTNMVKLSIYN